MKAPRCFNESTRQIKILLLPLLEAAASSSKRVRREQNPAELRKGTERIGNRGRKMKERERAATAQDPFAESFIAFLREATSQRAGQRASPCATSKAAGPPHQWRRSLARSQLRGSFHCIAVVGGKLHLPRPPVRPPNLPQHKRRSGDILLSAASCTATLQPPKEGLRVCVLGRGGGRCAGMQANTPRERAVCERVCRLRGEIRATLQRRHTDSVPFGKRGRLHKRGPLGT